MFSYRKGKLTRLGEISDLLFLSKATYFLKTYTVLEENELIGHTGHHLRMVLRDEGTALTLDADLTWVLNHEQYSSYELYRLNCGPGRFEGDCGHDTKVAAIFNATLAKLTGRPRYVDAILARTKERLSPSEFDLFVQLINRVTPIGVVR